MLAMSFLNTLTVKPMGNFIIANDHRICPLSNFNTVTYVVAMSMADEDEVCLNSFGGDGSSRIACQEGIDDDFVSSRLESKRSMSIPSEFCSHKSLLFELALRRFNSPSFSSPQTFA